MDGLARHARTACGDGSGLGSHDGRVHLGEFVGYSAVDCRPRAVAVVERFAVAREDVDDHRLFRFQFA